MDAYLVEIESPEENTWIYQHVKSIPGKIFMETKIALHICIYLYIYFFLNSRFDFSWILQKKILIAIKTRSKAIHHCCSIICIERNTLKTKIQRSTYIINNSRICFKERTSILFWNYWCIYLLNYWGFFYSH